MDFAYLKEIVKSNIIDKVDHQFLNEVIPSDYQPTTAENIVAWIGDTIGGMLDDVASLRIQLWETETSSAEMIWSYAKLWEPTYE